MTSYTPEQIAKLKIATKETNRCISLVKELSVPGETSLNVFRKVMESYPKEFIPAFPLLISINSELAHCTPTESRNHVFKRGDVVSVDFGLAVDRELLFSDMARTFIVGDNSSNSSYPFINQVIQFQKELCLESVKKAGVLTLEGLNNFMLSYIKSKKIPDLKIVRGVSGHEITPGMLHGMRGVSIGPLESKKKDFKLPTGVFTVEPLLALSVGSNDMEDGDYIDYETESKSELYLISPMGSKGDPEDEKERVFLRKLLSIYGDASFGCYFSFEQLVLKKIMSLDREKLRTLIFSLISKGYICESPRIVLPEGNIGFHWEEIFYIPEGENPEPNNLSTPK